MLADSEGAASDDAIQRLTPNPYPDDKEAGAEFLRLTRGDLLSRRESDANTVLETLRQGTSESQSLQVSGEDARSWMRTLAALRLVLASRLGITNDGDENEDDPRYGVYEWLGYHLEQLVTSL